MLTHTLTRGSRIHSLYQKPPLISSWYAYTQHNLQHHIVTGNPIPPAFRLAMLLYCLARGVPRNIIHLFTLAPNGQQSMFVINRLNVHAQRESFFLEANNRDSWDNNSHEIYAFSLTWHKHNV